VDRRVLAAIYRRVALLLQTSDRDGFGLPVAEAMTCGTPVVASDLPALMAQGRFRGDLYYRLNVSTIRLPNIAGRRQTP
jgi:hypothetical protein